jgi:hypothetical protein
VREISSRTEQYWCPIKHALRIADPHQRYFEFLEYGDADGYRARLGEFRRRLREGENDSKGAQPHPVAARLAAELVTSAPSDELPDQADAWRSPAS